MMACAVNIKLGFFGLILLQFDNANQVMQNPTQKFRKSSTGFDKPSILSEKLKTLMSSNYHGVKYFLLRRCAHLLLTNIYKGVFYKNECLGDLKSYCHRHLPGKTLSYLPKDFAKRNMALKAQFQILTLACVWAKQPVNI